MQQFSKALKRIKLFCVAVLCACSFFLFSGCGFFDFTNDISSVRRRVEKLRYEMSEMIIDAFKNDDVSAVKNLFCRKTREIGDIDSQIRSTFSFMDGEIESYKISGSSPSESYSNNYGTITEYSFTGQIFITTDTESEYILSLTVIYIAQDSVIEGLTSYSVAENYNYYDDYKVCRAGFGWQSPYDDECGILSAKLINAVSARNMTETKSLLCKKTLDNPSIDGELDAVFGFFDGSPVFNERDDGLYGNWKNEEDFTCLVIGYEIYRDKSGGATGVWVSVKTDPVITDSGKRYALSFSAYLYNETDSDIEGISWFSFENLDTDEEKQAGSWIH